MIFNNKIKKEIKKIKKEGILKEHKGDVKQIAKALMTAKQQLKEAGAKDEELVKFINKKKKLQYYI